MSFAQLTGRESLRDIEACLRAIGPQLYHAGMKARVSRTTLAKANELRDRQIYRDIRRIITITNKHKQIINKQTIKNNALGPR